MLASYLARIHKVPIPELEPGSSPTVSEFYSDCIAPLLPESEIVKQWHVLLQKYVNDSRAVFFLRKYASASNNDWMQIRRGFLTVYDDDSSYVFCDNFFAHYFYTMAYDGYVPEYEDFVHCIASRSFPYGFRVTKEELPLQAYKKGKAPHINDSGWKLAHLYSVNGRDYSFDFKGLAKHSFPRGNRSEWSSVTDDGLPCRRVERGMKTDEWEALKAHFLRLVDPMNYFLVPKCANERDVCGNNIGELDALLAYVHAQQAERFGTEFNLYEMSISASSKYRDVCVDGDFRIDVDYGFGARGKGSKARGKDSRRTEGKSKSGSLQKNKAKKSKSVRKRPLPVSQEQLYAMARLYLEDSMSFRTLERRVLGIESSARGGGFIAKTALNDFGITAGNKGAVSAHGLREELESASGKYKRALMEIYANQLHTRERRK